jgi:hypothetical protein
MLYVGGQSGMLAEAEQILLGIKLDLNYSKARILRMYAAVAYFGHGYYGLAAASCGYFAEQPAGLSWGQAAMLAGLVQAPSAGDPFSHFANARAREAHVLVRLIAMRQLTPAQATQAYWLPVHLARGVSADARSASCVAHSRSLPVVVGHTGAHAQSGQAAGQDNALLVLEMLSADRHGGPDRTPPRRRSGGLHGCFTDDPADVIVVGDRVSHPCGGPRPVPNKGR